MLSLTLSVYGLSLSSACVATVACTLGHTSHIAFTKKNHSFSDWASKEVHTSSKKGSATVYKMTATAS